MATATENIINLKGKFPFRLGATSYVVPGDISANVNLLSHSVDDIELVIFESDEIAALPDEATIMELRRIALHDDLTFTVHLPLDIRLGESGRQRQKSVDKCLRVIERMTPLSPVGFVLHCNRNDKNDAVNCDVGGWQKNIEKSIDEMLLSGLPSDMLCIETLDYQFEIIEPVISHRRLGICLDIGHILFNDLPLENYMNRYFDKARIFHMHGIQAGKDHCDLSAMDNDRLSTVLARLSEKKRRETVVTIEVFNARALNASLSVMEKFTT